MNITSIRVSIKKKIVSPLLHFNLFSSHQLKHKAPSKRLDKALRVLDIISSKPRPTSGRGAHLQLIQDFLQTDSNTERLTHDSVPTVGLTDLFDEFLQSSSVEKENSVSSNLDLDASVLSTALTSCTASFDIHGGIQYHCLTIRSGFVANVYIGSSLISFYGGCGEMVKAYKVFEEMPVRNVVSWTAIISAFAQDWQIDTCLDLYRQMRNSSLEPNDFTFTSILSACTGSGALGHGRSAHGQILKQGLDAFTHVGNALISMYCKCGSIGDAFYLFSNMDSKDTVSWNSMIAGYALHGLAVQAIDLFEEMKKQPRMTKPDAITFLNVLSSCRHAGLVEKGKFYFNSMVDHGLKPELDHYSCIVDLLGRAGLLEEALDFIKKMPICPNAVVWGSLLSSCRVHGGIWIGIEAAKSRLLLEPECAGTHIQLANLYASARSWDEVARVRKVMKDKGLKTNPGCSWIEIKNDVHRFRAEDRSSSELNEILTVVDCLVDHMKMLGHVFESHEEVYDD